MTQTATKQWSATKLMIAIAIVAIVAGAATGLTVGYNVKYEAPTTKTFYMFDRSLPFDEGIFGYPHDTFVPDTITVNKGDHVLIHFVDIESTPEGHTFSLAAPYTVNAIVYPNATEHFAPKTLTNVPTVILGMSENATITFTANWAGVFPFKCDIHQPTMTGYLSVLG